MAIKFTQYLRPDGRPIKVEVDRPAHIESMADELQAYGCKFEIEVLTNGMVNIEIMLPDVHGEEALAGDLAENGPPLLDAIDRMVEAAHRQWQVLARANG